MTLWNDTDAPPARESAPMTVSQLTAQIRTQLEQRFPRVWVEGEISNWSPAASGHVYFNVKDEGALISCVLWKSARGRVTGTFRDGDRVELRGRLSVFDKRGQYQLVADSLKPLGEGLLWQKFLELKARLEAEGLFDPARKRPIPKLPTRVGVITSPTGAAIRDILTVLHRRAPGVEVLLWPARVQGDGAALELATAVRKLSRSGMVEVIIVGRGGGSLEDLWAFNDERLAREIASSPVPVISAVGHEIDFSISDFVADLRAATPSAAAELVSADHAQLRARVMENRTRLDRAVLGRMSDLRSRLRMAMNSYALREPEAHLRAAQQRTDDALRRLESALDRRITAARHRAASATAALAGHNPELILQKGYAIVRSSKDKRVITRAARLRKAQNVDVQFQDGTQQMAVTDNAPDMFDEG